MFLRAWVCLELRCAPFLLGRYDKDLCPAHLISPSAVGISSLSDFTLGQQQVLLQAGAGEHQGDHFGSLALRKAALSCAMLSIKELLGVCL